jgi:hypothetical protein
MQAAVELCVPTRFSPLLLARTSCDSSVGIATCYGLDGLRCLRQANLSLFSNASTPTQATTQPSIEWVQGSGESFLWG